MHDRAHDIEAVKNTPHPGLLARALTFLLLLCLGLGTSPLPPPYDVYVVAGRIVRGGDGPRANFTIVLAGKLRGYEGAGFIRMNASSGNLDGGSPVALSDSSGAFTLQARSDQPADSLRLEVVFPDRPPLTGPPFSAAEVPGIPTTETVTYDEEDGFFDCSADHGGRRIVLFTTYRYEERTLEIPF